MFYERQPLEITSDMIKQAFEHAKDDFPNEACGVFTLSCGYVRCKNVAEKPTRDFTMLEYRRIAANEDDVLAIFHSHTNGRNSPTAEDMRYQISTAKPWGIAVLDDITGVKDCFFWGSSNIPRLLGRQYRSGVSDCYGLVKDAYKLWYNIFLPEFPRDDHFWAQGKADYNSLFSQAGFYQIDPKQIKPGDVLFCKQPINHSAIVLNDKEIIHHELNRLSKRDPLARWFRCLNVCLRHVSFKNTDGPPTPPRLA